VAAATKPCIKKLIKESASVISGRFLYFSRNFLPGEISRSIFGTTIG